MLLWRPTEVSQMALENDVEEYLRVNGLTPEEASTASLADSLGAHPAEVADHP